MIKKDNRGRVVAPISVKIRFQYLDGVGCLASFAFLVIRLFPARILIYCIMNYSLSRFVLEKEEKISLPIDILGPLKIVYNRDDKNCRT